jgi:hypothetical protein
MVPWRGVPVVRVDPLDRAHPVLAPPVYSNYQHRRTRKSGVAADIIYCRKSVEGVVVFHAEVGHPTPASGVEMPTNEPIEETLVGFSEH